MTGCWSALNIYLPGLSDVDLKEDQPWVTDEEQPWLTESSLDLVGEGTRGEATSNRGVSHIPGHQMVTLNLRSFLFIGAYLANLRTAL